MKVIIPVLASFLILGTFGLSHEAYAQTDIFTCQTLSIAGETYVLMADITTSGSCFTINADNITFDGNKDLYTITGDGTGDGILNAANGVTVKNSAVRSFSNGIVLAGNGQIITENIIESNTSVGIRTGFSSGHYIANNILNSNDGSGIYALGAINSIATGNIANLNQIGIYFHTGDNNIISNNVVKNSYQGFWMHNQPNSQLSDNTVTTSTFGFFITSTQNSEIKRNLVDSNGLGILIDFENSNNVISENIIQFNSIQGMQIVRSSNNNQIFNNDFLNNLVQISVFPESNNNFFNLPLPTGGNYWSNYDESSEGCNNIDNDNFCDLPLAFPNGQDNLPWTRQKGWQVTIVNMDVKPDDDNNKVNCKSKGVTPIGVFSTGGFDATTIDPLSIMINDVAVTEKHNKVHIEDLDFDGLDDAVLHISSQDLCALEYPITMTATAKDTANNEIIIQGSSTITLTGLE